MKTAHHYFLFAAIAALALGGAIATAQTRLPPDRDQLERKLASTATLIESSSAAKQIQASGIAAASQQRTKAQDLHRQAGDALRGGQLESAAKLLDDASRALFEGVKLADAEGVAARKQKTDFDNRFESTRALLEAQKRIAAEKNAGPRAGELTRAIEAKMAQATELARGGKMVDAKRTIDEAYLAVRASIGTLRDGDTVVRSLNFATKAEEYAYEIDRNDTHRMLVQMLLKEKRGMASVDAMVEQAVQSANQLRAEAEQQAARRDHDTAVKKLEQSTRELVRAIRSAGVYIPG